MAASGALAGAMTFPFRPGVLFAAAAIVFASRVLAADWPQWLGTQRDAVWRETGIVEKFPEGGPKRLWRADLGAGYSGPAVAGGRVYVMDRHVPAEIPKPKSPFDASMIPGNERVVCLDEKTGEVLWKHEYDCPYTVSYAAGPRTTPLVAGERVFTLGTMGDLKCLDAKSGNVIWSRDFKKDYGLKIPTWGVSAHPLLDGQKLICVVGGEGSVAVAFDKDTGKELWRALSAKEPGYCPPMIYEFAGRRQLILWHAEAVNGLDPETGAVFWTEPWKLNYGMAIATPRKLGEQLYLSCFYNGSMMLRFEPGTNAPAIVWKTAKMSERDTRHLNCTMNTPFIEDGHIYGACSYGEYRCLRADTGERVWETFAPSSGKSERWGNCFTIKNGSRFFLFSEKGDLIIANLSSKGYEEISRARLVEPVNTDPGRPVVWVHPAFANRHIYIRNDQEIVCFDLSAN
jgi:outer membrane protein assembly factor BamB